MLLVTQLLFAAVKPQVLLASQWNVEGCSGPPSSMVKFNMSDPRALKAPPGEVWPAFFAARASDYTIQSCGAAKIKLSQDCCYEFVSASPALAGFLSGSHYPASDNLQKSAPASANNQTYCRINALDKTSLFGFQTLYLNTKQECYMGMKCNNTIITLFQDRDCQKVDVTNSLSTTSQELKNTILAGNIGVSVETFTDGNRKYSWISQHPSNDVVVTLNTDFERFCFFLYLLSVFGNFFVGIYFARLAIVKRTKYMIYVSVSSFLWVVYIVLKLCYFYMKFPTTLSLFLCTQALNYFLNFATLSSVLATTYMIQTTSMLPARYNRPLYAFVGCIHLFFAGANYFQFLSNSFVKSWAKLNDYWIVFMFCWAIVPSISLALVLQRMGDKGIRDKIKILYAVVPKYIWTLAAELIVCIIFYSQQAYRNNTELWGKDQPYLASTGIPSALLTMHQILNLMISINMGELVKNPKLRAATSTYSFKTTKNDSKNALSTAFKAGDTIPDDASMIR